MALQASETGPRRKGLVAWPFLPMARRSMLTGRGLLIGGAFYVAYLAVVLAGGMGTT